MKGFKFNKKWWVLAVIIIILLMAFLFIRIKYVPPITNIITSSLNPNEIYIKWKDDEDDKLYTIYWSNRPGIKIHDPKTYTGMQTVSGKEFKLKTSYDVVYFKLTKKGRKTAEYEVLVMKDQRFTVTNLQPIITSSKNSNTSNTKERFMNVRILQDADIYHLYQKYPNGTTIVQDFDVHNQERIELKLNSNTGLSEQFNTELFPLNEKPFTDNFFYLTYEKNNYESEPVFLLYDESIQGSAVKPECSE